MKRNPARCLDTCCALVLLLVGAVGAYAQTTQEIATTALNSTVMLTMEDAEGRLLRYGSGFVVDEGRVASSFHVVDGALTGYANLVAQNERYDVEGMTAVDRERDIVVLKVSAAGLPVLPLGNSDSVQVGDVVYAAGNPQGWQGTFSQGIVSGIRQVGTQELLQITAPISPGSSGGPVLNSAGEVIGLAVSTVRDGQNLNFAIPVDHLKALLESSGPTGPFASQDDAALSPLARIQALPRRRRAARLRGSRTALSARGRMGERRSAAGHSGTCTPAAWAWRTLTTKQRDGIVSRPNEATRTLSSPSGACTTSAEALPRDFTESARWFRLAAEQGHAEAQRWLGMAYFGGHGVPKNHAEGEKWLRRAAELGDTKAQTSLGGRYYSLRNYAESARWYRLAADQGDSIAQREIGDAYYYGRGISEDYAEAARWYQLAADQGDSFAQSSLGRMYYYGEGVPQNYVEAAKWFRARDRVESMDHKRVGSEVPWDSVLPRTRSSTRLHQSSPVVPSRSRKWVDCKPDRR